jgi:hypothetical protein
VVIRSSSTSDERFAHTGALRYAADVPRIPAVAISNPDADALVRQFETGKSVRVRIRSSSRDLAPARSANVIGEIPGSDRGGEIVVLGAHLDSWDPGVGAVDDGAGVAIMMTVAKLINELDQKPRRTIRVVLFANEEFGTSGSQAYVAALQGEADRHVLGFEADFGAGPVWRLSSRVNPAQLPAVDQIYRALGPLKLVRGDNKAGGGADLEGLAKLGMPILEPGLDGTLYFDVHHTVNDTLAKVDPAALRQAVAAFAVSVWLGAQFPGGWERATTQRRRAVKAARVPASGGGAARPAPGRESGAWRQPRIQHRMCRAARQAEAVGTFPGANPCIGRVRGRRQFRQLIPTTVFRMQLCHRKAGAVIRVQFAGDHRQYVFQWIRSRVTCAAVWALSSRIDTFTAPGDPNA